MPVYSNSQKVAYGRDKIFSIGFLHRSNEDEIDPEPEVTVCMVPLGAVALRNALAEMIKQYEDQHGPIGNLVQVPKLRMQ